MEAFDKIIRRLEKARIRDLERGIPGDGEAEFYNRYPIPSFSTVMLVPHEENYHDALKIVDKDDIVCDMGAGDLRFALMLSGICKKVYAVEWNPVTVHNSLKIIGYQIPKNVVAICAHWDEFPIPDDVTKIIALVQMEERSIPVGWFRDGRRVFLGTLGDVLGEGVAEVLKGVA
jgi:hypothetical protein